MYCIQLHRTQSVLWFQANFQREGKAEKVTNVVDSSWGGGFKVVKCFGQWAKSGTVATYSVKNILYERVKNEPIKKHNRGTLTQSNLAVMPQCPKYVKESTKWKSASFLF